MRETTTTQTPTNPAGADVPPAAVLSDIKARLEYERSERQQAERDIRDANARYKAADGNVRALERLVELYTTFAAGADFDAPVPY